MIFNLVQMKKQKKNSMLTIPCQIFGSFGGMSATTEDLVRNQRCFALTGVLVEFRDRYAGCYQFIALQCSFIILTKRATLVDIY